LIILSVPPFFPDLTGVPDAEDGPGPNFTVAEVRVETFLCPSEALMLNLPG
jgi:hypothetical protein